MSDNKDEWNELLKKLKLHRATFANDADKLEEDNIIAEVMPLTDTRITQAFQTYLE
jgi:DNA-binding Lrp family transcriptional regulator